MREIRLTQGKVAIVDDEDYEALSRHKWFAQQGRRTWYAKRDARGEGQGVVYMHRVVSGAATGVDVDHVSGDGLDNRKQNLRQASRRENCRNQRKRVNASSPFKGVAWHAKAKKWAASINDRVGVSGGNASSRHLGLHNDPESAARAYDAAAVIAFGEFAAINFPSTEK